MNKLGLFLAVTLVSVTIGMGPAFALIPNGDFEAGDLSGYKTFEGLLEVPSTDLVKNVDDGTGNHLAQINSGFFSKGAISAGLERSFGVLSTDVQDLFFDVQFNDLGLYPGMNTNGQAPFNTDFIWSYLVTDQTTKSLFSLSPNELLEDNPAQTSYEILPNGFYRFKTDMTSYSGKDVKLHIDLFDKTNSFQSRGFVDNIDLTSANNNVVPEPASLLLVGGGLAGIFWRSRKSKKG